MNIREEFETACNKHAVDAGFPECEYGFERSSEDGNCYSDSHTQAAWWAWQTSRAAIIIELPDCQDAKPYACYEGGWNDMRDEAVDAIQLAGCQVGRIEP
jgi:hypothetical protein